MCEAPRSQRSLTQYHTPATSGQATRKIAYACERVFMRTVLLLLLSNAFMTVAWYGHLKFKNTHLLLAIGASWLIALPEYALQVPANRFGHGQFTAPQLKIIQEAISIGIFLVFSIWYLGESPRWNDWAAMALILAAVIVMMVPRMLYEAAGPAPP